MHRTADEEARTTSHRNTRFCRRNPFRQAFAWCEPCDHVIAEDDSANAIALISRMTMSFLNNALASQVPELEEVLAGCNMQRRGETLHRITDLFVATASQLGEAHIAVFDEVILRLSQGIEFRVRVELAERLADHENAPPDTARSLAHDENIAIAGPMLQRSPRLAEADLVLLPNSAGRITCAPSPAEEP